MMMKALLTLLISISLINIYAQNSIPEVNIKDLKGQIVSSKSLVESEKSKTNILG